MIDRSTSRARSMSTCCSRLPVTRRRTSMPGERSWKRASSCGTKYLAVLTMPMVSRPTSMRFRRATASSASFIAASSLRAWIRKYSPAVDSVALRPSRGRQRQPDLRLYLLDLHGNGGGREIQRRRGAGHAALLGHLDEHPQLAEGHVH